MEGSRGLLGAIVQCAHELGYSASLVAVYPRSERCAWRRRVGEGNCPGALVRVIVAARSVAMLDEHQNAARAPFHSRDNAERTTDGARARDCNHRSFLPSELIPHYNNNTPHTVQQFMLCSNHTVNVA